MNSTSFVSVGAGVLLANGPGGWQPQALLLTSPVLLVRYREGVAGLYTPGSDAPFKTYNDRNPLKLLEQVLMALQARVPAAGPKAGKPSFPLALLAASYEFGQRFAPHQGCFPHSEALEDDEFFASIFMDAYRPDSQGNTERMGYAGLIPEGWIKGAPALGNRPHGHDAPPVLPWPVPEDRPSRPLATPLTAEHHAAALRRIHEYLAAGDIYQANFTVPFQAATFATPEDLFDVGLGRGGAAFAGTFITPTGTLVSFSPELLLRRRGHDVETRPIKGTRVLPANGAMKLNVAEDLLSSQKDAAEHIMIVDLERNDLGRVCTYGSVAADPLMKPVEHPTVLHLESTVRGTLKAGMRLQDIFAAIFPGGSVTGAPKKRAMEIIGELEGAPRGYYCGAFGWIDCDGDCELSLPIRTAMLRPDGRVSYNAGGGIVADSDPQQEWDEVFAKTAFFEGVLKEAERVCQYDDEEH